MVGSGEGNVIVKEAGEFSCEGRGELGSSIRDDLVVEVKLWEDVLKKDFGDVHGRCGFVAGVENYPL